eukprot:6183165-Pleurochrysis_carterae.AAC.1
MARRALSSKTRALRSARPISKIKRTGVRQAVPNDATFMILPMVLFGDKCDGAVARGMISAGKAEEEEESDYRQIDIERQEGRREVEKFVHGVRNAEIVGGPANERRMRHATREGNKPSFWTYLKENCCKGCQKQEEEETIQHVISGGCDATGRKMFCWYKIEMKKTLEE